MRASQESLNVEPRKGLLGAFDVDGMADRDASEIRRRFTVTIALVGLVALAIWLRYQLILVYGGFEPSYVNWADQNFFGGITRMYLAAADAIRARQPYPSLAYPPGYPGFLALLQALGWTDLQQLRYAQATLDALAVPVTYAVARRTEIGRSSSLVAAALYAIYPTFAAGAGLLTAEALSPALLIATLWLTLKVSAAPSAVRLAGIGLWLAIVSMIRPDFFLLIGFIAVWLWCIRRLAWRPILIAAYVGGFCLGVFPWGVYNRVAHGAWVFTSTGGSVGLWEGLGEIPNPYGYVLNDGLTKQLLEREGLRWQSVEADRYLRNDYLRVWREHPAFGLRVIRARWRSILESSEQLRTSWLRPVQTAFDRYGIYVWLIALVGAARRPSTWLVLGVPVAYALLSIGLVHYEARYVRYVDWSYAVAVALLPSSLAAFAKTRAPKVEGIFAVAVFGGLGLAMVGAVPGLRSETRSAQFEKMVEDSPVLAGAIVLPGSDWQTETGTIAARVGDGWHFTAPPGRYEYIATRTFDVLPSDLVMLSYDLTLVNGGLTIGILDSSRAWLTSVNAVIPGNYRGRLAKGWRSGKQLTVVLARDNDAAAPTEFTLRDTTLQVLRQ